LTDIIGYCVVPPGREIFRAGLVVAGVQVMPPFVLALKNIPIDPSVQATDTFDPTFCTLGSLALPRSLLRLKGVTKLGALLVAANDVLTNSEGAAKSASDKTDTIANLFSTIEIPTNLKPTLSGSFLILVQYSLY
jgi:hypothetical protein